MAAVHVTGDWELTAVAMARALELRAAHARFGYQKASGTEVWRVPHSPFRIFDTADVEVSRQGYVWCSLCHDEPCSAAGATLLRLTQRKERSARAAAA